MKHALVYLLACITALHASAASITCTFTAADNTALESYSNGAEATWSENTAFTTGNILISDSNRAHTDTTNASFYYVNNFTPATYNYDIEATVHFKSVPTSNSTYFGVGGRMTSTSATGGYVAWLVKGGSGWYLQLARAGLSSIAVSSIITTPSSGVDYQIKLEMRDHTMRIWWNGSVVLTKHIDVTGSDWISGVGKPFLWMDGVTSFLTDSTGIHVDNYTVTDAPAVSTTGEIAVDNDDLWFNGYDGTGNPRQSQFAEWRFTTNAQILVLKGTTDLEDDIASANNLGLWVDNVRMTPFLAFTSNGQTTFTFYLSTTLGATKTVRFTGGLQGFPVDETYPQGVYLDSVECRDWFTTATYTLIPEDNTGKVVVYGDSIATGQSTSHPTWEAWPTYIRNVWGKPVATEAWGFRALEDDASDNTARTAFAAHLVGYNPQYIWISIGTNDYGASGVWDATAFGVAYADLLDKIHALDPTIKIFCQSPIQRVNSVTKVIEEPPNTFGDTLDDFRTEISNAVSTRTSFCTYVNGGNGAILDSSTLADGIHPSTEGNRQYADFVHRTIWQFKINGAGSTVIGTTGTTIVK